MFSLFLVMYFPVSTRSATGEDWHKIMLACYDVAKCDKSVDIKKYGEHCGTTAGAIIFFCTFIFLCMFLVSDEIHEYKNTSKEILSFPSAAVKGMISSELSYSLSDVEFICGCYHG